MGVDSHELTQEVVDLEVVPVYLDESSTVVVGRPNTYARGWNECRESVLLNNHGNVDDASNKLRALEQAMGEWTNFPAFFASADRGVAWFEWVMNRSDEILRGNKP